MAIIFASAYFCSEVQRIFQNNWCSKQDIDTQRRWCTIVLLGLTNWTQLQLPLPKGTSGYQHTCRSMAAAWYCFLSGNAMISQPKMGALQKKSSHRAAQNSAARSAKLCKKGWRVCVCDETDSAGFLLKLDITRKISKEPRRDSGT